MLYSHPWMAAKSQHWLYSNFLSPSIPLTIIILLRRLSDWFRFTGKSLDPFLSYLTPRCRRIKLGYCLYFKAYLPFEVPQWSVLGHLLFTLYTNTLSSMISGHSIPNHTYPNDNQQYVSAALGHSAAAGLNGFELSLASVHSWMSMGKLKLNPDKTEFRLIENEQPVEQ